MKKGGDLVLYRNRREEISSYIETEETRSRFTSKQKGRDLVLYRNRMDEISSYIETEETRSRLTSKQKGRDLVLYLNKMDETRYRPFFIAFYYIFFLL